jgi:hypothetical protein
VLLAHAFGARYDLPIPLILFVLGGAAVVVLSFLLVLPRPVKPQDSDNLDLPDQPTAGRLHPLWGPQSIIILILLTYCALAGSDEVAENIVPSVFWLLVWIAAPLVCGVVGDWTPSVNPFATLARLTDRPRLRKAVLNRSTPLSWTFGWWPAVVLFFTLACAELIYNLTTTEPHVIGLGFVFYAAANLLLGLLYGPAWLERGEVFSVLFATWGRLGFWRFGAPGHRGFAGGLVAPFERSTSRVAFVMLLLISVNFDGLLATPQWTRFERARIGLDLTAQHNLRLLSFIVLTAVILLVFGAFALASARAGGHGGSPREALSGLLPSLVPIAFGYLLAHNLAYLLVNGQLLAPLVNNPTGKHAFGLPYPFNDSYEVSHTFLPSSFYWYVGGAVIIAVHVAAVILAHRHLAGRGIDPRAAHRSEYPWLVAMVGYTAFSLFLIAQPLVQDKPSSGSDATPTRAATSTVASAATAQPR